MNDSEKNGIFLVHLKIIDYFCNKSSKMSGIENDNT